MSIMTTLSRIGGRGLLQAKKYSPEILTGLGIAGMIGSTILAVKNTPEAQNVVENTKSDIQDLKENREMHGDEYPKHLATVYTRATIDLGKLYGPSVTLGVASVGSILAAHGIMRRRNAALIAGYKVIESTLAEYRARVEEELGADRESDIFHGVSEEKKDGEVVRTIPNGPSQYARFFDELCSSWQSNPEYNLLFLRAQQNYANDLLRSRGHIFLNEVYDMIGVPRSQAGQVVGWVLNKGGDNYVDFGIYDDLDINHARRQFVNGQEHSILLDFNVDGVVYDLI